jgi:hypothetical protein
MLSFGSNQPWQDRSGYLRPPTKKTGALSQVYSDHFLKRYIQFKMLYFIFYFFHQVFCELKKIVDMGNSIFLEHNIEGRKERAPLGVACYLFNLIGVIGNILVLHVFRKRINASSNYRVFVLFLSIVDMFTCIAHLAKETNRMIAVYSQSSHTPYICKISHYIGNSVGYASVLVIGFIAFERYRKICTPFKPQITVTQSKIISILTMVLGFIVEFPIYVVHGRRNVSVENINATRCAIENKYDEDLLPIVHLGIIFTAAVIYIVIIIVLQVKIRIALVEKAKTKQRMKYVVSTVNSEAGQNAPSSGVPQSKSNRPKSQSKKSADEQESERNRRIAIRFAIISTFLIVSFVSQTVFQFVTVTQRYFFPKQRISKLEDVVEEYFPDIVAVNGILNPFVYLFTDNEFKQELMKMCGRGL